jgi:hypothetical protein
MRMRALLQSAVADADCASRAALEVAQGPYRYILALIGETREDA